MTSSQSKPRPILAATRAMIAAALAAMLASPAAVAAGDCAAERPRALLPANAALCASLETVVRAPSALPLDQYEAKLDAFFANYCHRNKAAGWRRDKGLRDTGPFTARFSDGAWTGEAHGTHAPVVIWYSPEMAEWLTTYRPVDGRGPSDGRGPVDGRGPADPPPVPDGAMMVKEMFPAPAAACNSIEPERLFPSNGAAIMVRDASASHDGWFWGWYGWPGSGWAPDWPPAPTNPITNMGFAQYCLNCHASAENNLTFAAPGNIQGEPGEPLVFLSQSFFAPLPSPDHHSTVSLPDDDVRRLGQPHYRPDSDVVEALRAYALDLPTWESVSKMPSQTYDHTWVSAGGPDASDAFLTSSQCLGCHDAGSTGLQFDMTEPGGDRLHNLSPFAAWRTSPMGLAGRDPFFFAQLASETETFHPDAKGLVEDTCLGCHGVTGQRQFHIDTHAETGNCGSFGRTQVNAVPWPDDTSGAGEAKYGALARDGISCTACHRMALGEAAAAEARSAPENACVAERQALLNPDNSGFAKTFTGSFLVGPPDRLIGPFEDPKTKPMENALGITPEHHASISSSEVCGTCHTVHLPVLKDGQVIAHTYEQTTYPEWAFSAYRTGETPDGPLPHGRGSEAQSCQDCHMPSRAPSRATDGTVLRSKIASIQEYTSFPQAEHTLPADDIDLPERDGFSVHTLVGLNVFLTKMAQQFPDILGIRTRDPMLGSRGIDPLVRTEQAMLDLAANDTADISLSGISNDGSMLRASVTVTNKAGHKFPSGVGFRRAFLEFRVLDQNRSVLWASGRTNAAGALVDATGEPLEGEYWWADDCSARLRPDARPHQPHYQSIRRQDQAQIYQELVSTPPAGDAAPQCGPGEAPQGALTTSFLSICAPVKDNRILPHGYLGLNERIDIAAGLGAGAELAHDAGSTGVGDDPDYVTGGSDSVVYEIPLADLAPGASPAHVEARLYYQATPPFYLQDRFCTSGGEDAKRLKFLVGHLNLDGTQAEGWKLEVASTGAIAID